LVRLGFRCCVVFGVTAGVNFNWTGDSSVIAGSGGVIEHIVFTTTPVFFTLATLPEILAQGLMFGYLLVFWERRAHQR